MNTDHETIEPTPSANDMRRFNRWTDRDWDLVDTFACSLLSGAMGTTQWRIESLHPSRAEFEIYKGELISEAYFEAVNMVESCKEFRQSAMSGSDKRFFPNYMSRLEDFRKKKLLQAQCKKMSIEMQGEKTSA